MKRISNEGLIYQDGEGELGFHAMFIETRESLRKFNHESVIFAKSCIKG